MKVYNTINGIQSEILKEREKGSTIGFVPTMGALHNGHLSLLEASVKDNDISVCSIFVNPIQFNNLRDLEKYPRTLDEDCRKLEKAGCAIVFTPSVEEMYPEGEVKESYDFGPLEHVMEGAHRPGHFKGVGIVVKRLFEICLPDKTYFGEKDFQQLMIIRALVKNENIPVEVIGCPIIREEDGLAMSSRNIRLSKDERKVAPEIYKGLQYVKQQFGKEPSSVVLKLVTDKLNALSGMKVEYLQLAEEDSLMPVNSWNEAEKLRVFIAAYLGNVRLIDNLKIK